MPKEVTFAILIGFILGLLITLGIYTANRAVKEQGRESKTERAVIPTPSPATVDQNSLTISEPTDEELFTLSEVLISGKTNPDSAVAILSEDDQTFVQADSDGFFTKEITLAAGINLVEVISTDPFGNQAKTSLLLSYSDKIELSEDKTDEE